VDSWVADVLITMASKEYCLSQTLLNLNQDGVSRELEEQDI